MGGLMSTRNGASSPFPGRSRQTSDRLTIDAETSDAILIQGCLGGKQLAWDLLLDRYARLIYSVPRRFGLSEDDAADVFQNVCVSLWRNLGALRDTNSLARWLLTVAQNECIETIARQKRDRVRVVESGDVDDTVDRSQVEDPFIPDLLEQLEEEHKLRLALAKLPDRCQQLLKLLYFDPTHPSYVEIAARLGLGSTAVGINRARCLERLRRILADAEE